MPKHTNKFRQLLADMRQWCWPSMGWRRFIRFQFLRLSQMSGGEKIISRGFACGVAVSLSPFIGLHFVIAALFAKTMRGNVIAAMIGTAVGNPWTFPFIWPTSFALGNKILDAQNSDTHIELELDWATLLANPLEIFLPMLVGCIPMMLIIWPVAYLISLRTIRWHKRKKRKRAELTGS